MRVLLFLTFAFVSTSTSPTSTSTSPVWVHSGNLSISLDSLTGDLLALNTSAGLILNAFGSKTTLGDTPSDPTVLNVTISPCGENNQGICVEKWLTVIAQHSNASCCGLYEVLTVTSFIPRPSSANGLPSSVAWTFNITSMSSLAWRTTIGHILNVSSTPMSSNFMFWTPRGGNSTLGWEDSIRMVNSTSRPKGYRTQYGINMLFDNDPISREVSSVPAAVIASETSETGLGLLQSLDDHVFGLALDVSQNLVTLNKYYNRLGEGRSVSLTTMIVPISGVDWRPLFLWARGAFPRFFLSSTLLADAAREVKHQSSLVTSPAPIPSVVKTGLGMYTCANIEDVNLTAIRLSGATHNWDAKFEWPYIGMYLPPISPIDANWTSNLGSGEEPDCGKGWSHGQPVNKSLINTIYANAASEGITTLTYFNVVEYGENFACPLPQPISPPPENDWQNSSQFAADHMPNSPWPGCPNTGWQNGVDLNPADQNFQAFLVAQAQLHVDSFGENFFGFAIDRLDHSTQWYNPAPAIYDDHLAWCGAPCFPMLTAMNTVFNKVANIVYSSSGRLMTGNFVGSQRVDILHNLDGIFEEDYLQHIQLVLTSGFATTGMPPIMIWTYDANEIFNYQPNVDAYFAQHVLFKASPFAPVLGNDHSIQPQMDKNGQVQDLYTAWAPFFSAYAGGCWWLVSEPIRIEAAYGSLSPVGVQTNAFTLGGGCTDVTIASGTGPVSAVVLVAVSSTFSSISGDSVLLSIADPFETSTPSSCESIVPGDMEWNPVQVPKLTENGRRIFNAPISLFRGAVMIKCNR